MRKLASLDYVIYMTPIVGHYPTVGALEYVGSNIAAERSCSPTPLCPLFIDV